MQSIVYDPSLTIFGKNYISKVTKFGGSPLSTDLLGIGTLSSNTKIRIQNNKILNMKHTPILRYKILGLKVLFQNLKCSFIRSYDKYNWHLHATVRIRIYNFYMNNSQIYLIKIKIYNNIFKNIYYLICICVACSFVDTYIYVFKI